MYLQIPQHAQPAAHEHSDLPGHPLHLPQPSEHPAFAERSDFDAQTVSSQATTYVSRWPVGHLISLTLPHPPLWCCPLVRWKVRGALRFFGVNHWNASGNQVTFASFRSQQETDVKAGNICPSSSPFPFVTRGYSRSLVSPSSRPSASLVMFCC
jgi:hypothetical protein